jgi:hypothetical protein
MLVRQTREYDKDASRLLDLEERQKIADYLLVHPEAGAIIPGTGGIRKLRWAASGRGKRGGARIIYFYHVAPQEIYLLTIYAKNERDDLSGQDKKMWTRFIHNLKKGRIQ